MSWAFSKAAGMPPRGVYRPWRNCLMNNLHQNGRDSVRSAARLLSITSTFSANDRTPDSRKAGKPAGICVSGIVRIEIGREDRLRTVLSFRIVEDVVAGLQAALPDNAGAGRRISRFGCRGRYGAEASVPSPPVQYTSSGSVSPTGSPLSSSRHLIAACVPSQ